MGAPARLTLRRGAGSRGVARAGPQVLRGSPRDEALQRDPPCVGPAGRARHPRDRLGRYSVSRPRHRGLGTVGRARSRLNHRLARHRSGHRVLASRGVAAGIRERPGVAKHVWCPPLPSS